MPHMNGTTDVRPEAGERTGKQIVKSGVIVTGGNAGMGLNPLTFSKPKYATYRRMRHHPTIALGRAANIAPVVSAPWSFETNDDAPDGALEFIAGQLESMRPQILHQAMEGQIDFGHQGWEKVFEVEDGRIILKKLKPLIQDNTEIMVNEGGQFVGFRQKDVTIDVPNALLISFRVEGTQWDGAPLLENSRLTWEQWRDANDGAARYDRKVAGSHWVVWYPDETVTDSTGADRHASEIATQMLQALESSGSLAVPNSIAGYVDSMNSGRSDSSGAWRIELLEDRGGRQPTFIDRLNYLDKLLIRGLLFPERSVLEGEHGTKAEAGEHMDVAMMMAEQSHQHIVRMLNWHVVDQLLALNYGPDARGAVRIEPGAIIDSQKVFMRDLYKLILSNPQAMIMELGMIDTDAMKDSIGVPKATEVASIQEGEGTEGIDPNDPQAATLLRILRRMNSGEAGMQE